MSGQVVHDDDIALGERGGELSLNINFEDVTVHWRVDNEGRGEAVTAQAGDKGLRLPVAERLLRRKINPNLYSIPDFKRRLREQQPFILEVLRGQKIYVLGDETDLDKVSGEEMNQLAG